MNKNDKFNFPSILGERMFSGKCRESLLSPRVRVIGMPSDKISLINLERSAERRQLIKDLFLQ